MNTDEIRAARDKAEAEILRILQDLESATGMRVEPFIVNKIRAISSGENKITEVFGEITINLKL